MGNLGDTKEVRCSKCESINVIEFKQYDAIVKDTYIKKTNIEDTQLSQNDKSDKDVSIETKKEEINDNIQSPTNSEETKTTFNEFVKKNKIKIAIFLICLCAVGYLILKPHYGLYADTLNAVEIGNIDNEVLSPIGEMVGTERKSNGKLTDLKVNKKFYKTYIKKYGLGSLLYSYNVLLQGEPNDEVLIQRYKKMREDLISLPEYKELECVIIDGKEIVKMEGKDGYYKGEKESFKAERETGKFNDEDNGNAVYEESAPQIEEVKYYGDWKVEHSHGLIYNEGEYEWRNGVFYDTPSSFDSYSTFVFYYRGKKYATVNAERLEDVHLEVRVVNDSPFYWQDSMLYEGVPVITWAE